MMLSEDFLYFLPQGGAAYVHSQPLEKEEK